MLHGFDASATTPGHELIAYVPSMVYPNLTKLLSQTYNATGSHQYFVDGNPTVGDAFIDPSSGGTGTRSWNTVLVGGMNAGAKGLYALNVTDPTIFTRRTPAASCCGSSRTGTTLTSASPSARR